MVASYEELQPASLLTSKPGTLEGLHLCGQTLEQGISWHHKPPPAHTASCTYAYSRVCMEIVLLRWWSVCTYCGSESERQRSEVCMHILRLPCLYAHSPTCLLAATESGSERESTEAREREIE